MSNGNEMLNEMDFDKKVSEMKERGELLEFVAKQVYKISIRCPEEDKRITALESQNKKMFGVTGGVSGVIGAGIVAALNWFFGAK
jgi:hypothetical protein